MNKIDSTLNKAFYFVIFISLVLGTILVLTGCTVTQSDSTTTLKPMRPTNVTVVITYPTSTTSIDVIPIASVNNTYIKTVEFFYGGTPSVSDQAIMEFGQQWCDLLIDGMQPDDVINRIYEGAIDNDDARMHFSIVNAAILELCPSQSHKSEEIALRSFLPEE
jgi:hypothetical protein